MKKYGVMFLTVLAQFAQAKGLEQKHQDRLSRQSAVEQALHLRVNFDEEKVQTFTVGERLAHYIVPGLSFALIDEGEIAWARGYGTTSALSDERVTVNTAFQAASIAKPVTAFAVMKMQDAGQVDVRADIAQSLQSLVLPDGLQSQASPVTLKNLLDHSSGLTSGGYTGYLRGKAIPSDIQTFTGEAPANSQPTKVESVPGEQVRYSGAGYTLVEIALQDKFNQPFERVMQQWALSKLDMQHSAFDLDYPEQKGVRVALGHDNLGAPIEGGWRVHPEQAAAGLWSTPTDLAKLAVEMSKAYKGQSTLLSQTSAQEMLAPVMPGTDLTEQFGGQPAMTFIVDGEGDRFLFKHGGGTLGYRCFMVMYPETGDGAVFMTNSDAGYGVGFEMLMAASAIYDWPGFKAKTYKRRQPDASVQDRFLGEYAFEAGWQIEVMAVSEADGIAVRFPNGDIYSLAAIEGQHTYIHQETGVEVRFSLHSETPQIHLYNQTAYQSRTKTIEH